MVKMLEADAERLVVGNGFAKGEICVWSAHLRSETDCELYRKVPSACLSCHTELSSGEPAFYADHRDQCGFYGNEDFFLLDCWFGNRSAVLCPDCTFCLVDIFKFTPSRT